MMEWIPFKWSDLERLPEEDQEILVTDGYYVWKDEWICNREGCCLGYGDIETITAWMPLPEPYKGE
ncbi:hypothetical protein M2140_001939 [Clostridiales Family XIII bacterium PM5-7]